jgi:plasmid stability protein
MPKLTVTADEEVIRWARVRAAERNTSVSRRVGELLRQHMESQSRYETARRRFMGRKAQKLSRARYPTRDQLHQRDRLR